MTAEPKILPNLQHLLFEASLYAIYQVPEGAWYKQTNLRGYCPKCKEETIYKSSLVRVPTPPSRPAKPTPVDLVCRCVQNEEHVVQFVLMFYLDTVQKSGQFPDFATITQGSTKPYRKVLEQQDATELNRAIGLAAHGVGIGSFVYVRRIFERLIHKRFEEFSAAEGWDAEKFRQIRMDERIELLRDHLPSLLVQSKKLYSILSVGIHQLDEQACLDFFDVAKSSIILILDEDRRKKEELAERKELSNAIASYKPPES